jgi:hypothetical protein
MKDVIQSKPQQAEKNKDYQLLLHIPKSEIEWMNLELSRTDYKVYFKIKDEAAYTLIADEICVQLLFMFLPDFIEIDLQWYEEGEQPLPPSQ